jgi:hypothetical protein
LELNTARLQPEMSNDYIAQSCIMKLMDIVRMNVNQCEEVHLKSCTYV